MKGEGNQQDYGMRVYDPRIAKFLSVDPLTKQYPWYTPYQFAGNKPIQFIDLDGAEEAEASNSTGPAMRPILGGLRTPAPMAQYSRYGLSAGNFAYEENPLSTAQADKSNADWKIREFWYNHDLVNNKLVAVPEVVAQQRRMYDATQSQKAREDKAFAFEKRYTFDPNKRRKTDAAEVYALTAKSAGWYNCVSCQAIQDDDVHYRTVGGERQIFLKAGETWKIGKTNLNGVDRYQGTSYEMSNFNQERIFQGTEQQALILEKSLIVGYYYHPENWVRTSGDRSKLLDRPAGNKRDK